LRAGSRPAGDKKTNINQNTPHPYDLVIGLDRSDKKADLHLITTGTGQRRAQTIDTAPEALWEWLLQLRQEHPRPASALCLEQPAVHLIAFLESYDWITLYPSNPITLQKYLRLRHQPRQGRRQGRAVSGRVAPDPSRTNSSLGARGRATRAVQQRVFHRRAVVASAPGLTNA